MQNSRTPRILIVDDVDTNRFILKDIIEEMGYTPVLTENGEQALKIVQRHALALIILDIAMPGMDGFEFCRILKADANTRDIPIIFISAYNEPADVVKGFELGGADYITKPFIPEVVRARVSLQLKLAEATGNLQELNRKLQVSMKEQVRQIEQGKRVVLYALTRVAKENAAYDEKYMNRLSKNCRILSEAAQLSPQFEDVVSDTFIETIEKAAPLCDLGNVAIPTQILQKEDFLTPQERDIMQTHAQMGAQILQDIEEEGDYNGFISMSREIAHYHHENWDGSGYPEGLKGDEIPLSAQIVSVSSAYSALTEGHICRKVYDKEEALMILEADAGSKYNPKLIEILGKIKRQLV
jgi:putative two-component system response regulator